MMRITQELDFPLDSIRDAKALVKADVDGFRVVLVEVLVHASAFNMQEDRYLNMLPILKIETHRKYIESFRDSSSVRDATVDWDEGA